MGKEGFHYEYVTPEPSALVVGKLTDVGFG